VLVSDVQDRLKLVAKYTLLGLQQRRAVAGVADFYKCLAARNPTPSLTPIIYLSASPRQLQSYLQQFLDHNAFPPGVLITRRLELEAGGDPVLDQIRYKTGKIESILPWFADVQFVLVGDDGEHDPETYNRIQTNPAFSREGTTRLDPQGTPRPRTRDISQSGRFDYRVDS
jgi:phosphatidate phosphatase APP1